MTEDATSTRSVRFGTPSRANTTTMWIPFSQAAAASKKPEPHVTFPLKRLDTPIR